MEISIKNYIETEFPELSGKLYPVFTTVLDDLSVVYTFTPNIRRTCKTEPA